MQNFSLKLFDNAHVLKPKAEQQVLTFLHFSIVINLLLPLYLIYSNGFFVGLLVLLLDLLIVFGYLLYVWLHQRPASRVHFTLTLEGVRYRTNVAEQEQAFDWEEVDTVQMLQQVHIFTLKNGEEHAVSLDKVQNEAMLRLARVKITKIAKRKDIQLL